MKFKTVLLTCCYAFAFGCMLSYTLAEGFTTIIALLWGLYIAAVAIAFRNAPY